MPILDKISDASNFGIGTFLSAPPLLSAAGVNPANKAIDLLLQGLVGIVLMFLTKSVTKYFERKKPAPLTNAVPVPIEPPKPIFINDKTENNGSKKKGDQKESPQTSEEENSKAPRS